MRDTLFMSIKCVSCLTPIPEASASCPFCGTAVVDPAAATIDPQAPPSVKSAQTPATPRSSRPISSVSSIDDSRFVSGAMLLERYRIVGLLGRGGMGEVYRAEDLKLGQVVALKFLPATISQDTSALARFHREVRIARQVSHPNVCRVFDIGEVEGQVFLSMEYIDGEDLGSLLRRIGHLPADKALEIARQLCAGLAAAHEMGVLHRDLKPANVMIDGRGKARITDFGLAVLGDDLHAGEARAGTPGYMAPEQAAGKGASTRSDIYSLGLVLYELFTGKRVFEAGSVAELLRRQEESAIAHPSALVKDIDPVVERVILRCLEKEPRARPANALQVALALPGGDPLAAALAAGETPSPEMVAAAAPETAISVRGAVLLLLAILGLFFASVPLVRRSTLLGLAPMAKSPDALLDRAHDIAKRLGYPEAPGDSAWWMSTPASYLNYRAEHETGRWYRELASAWPAPHRFNYRQSTARMVPQNPFGSISTNAPPMIDPDALYIYLDSTGHLLEFHAVPPRFEKKDAPAAGKVDWASVFKEAEIDFASFQPAEPLRIPHYASDERAAWEGKVNGMSVHVDGAAFHGKLVQFEVSWPWARSAAPPTPPPAFLAPVLFLLLVVVPVAALAMARHNLRLGRGDTKGATRLATFATLCSIAQTLLQMHYGDALSSIGGVVAGAGLGLFVGGATWVSYVALEPLVRRQSPHLLIAWTRLLSGRFADPLVGRDVLIGMAAYLAAGFLGLVPKALPWWMSLSGAIPSSIANGLVRPLAAAAQLPSVLWVSTAVTMAMLFIVAIARAVLRTRWVGLAIVLLLMSLPNTALHGTALVLSAAFALLTGVIWTGVLARFGPLAFAILFATSGLLNSIAPVALQLDSWYFWHNIVVALLLLALAVFAFRSALAGQPLFGKLLEDE